MYEAIAITQAIVPNQAKYKMIGNDGNNAIAIKRIVVLYQDVHDKTRADNGGNDILNLTSGYSTITISSTVPNLTSKFSTSINGEKYTSQSKYKDDYIKYKMKRQSFDIMQLAWNNHQDVHKDNNIIAILQLVFLVHEDETEEHVQEYKRAVLQNKPTPHHHVRRQ